MRLLAAILLFVTLGLVGMSQVMPAWAVVLVVAGLAIAGRWTNRRLMRAAEREKGRVLRGATFEVISVASTQFLGFVKGLDEEEAEKDPRRYFWVEIRVEPADRDEGRWRPHDLRVACDSSEASAARTTEAAHRNELQRFQDGRYVIDRDEEVQGSQRLRLHVGVSRDVRVLAFEYFGEPVGRIDLPS